MKNDLRARLLAERNALSVAEALEASRIIQQEFLCTAEFASASVIALYAAVRNEVGTAEVMRAALDAKKSVLFPTVCANRLFFRKIRGVGDLLPGKFGIPEPDPSCEACDPGEADVVVVPGVAFDSTGKRIGYGKGYYDKSFHYLERRGKLAGFCYDFQLVAEIVAEPHDVIMDMVVTDKRILRVKN